MDRQSMTPMIARGFTRRLVVAAVAAGSVVAPTAASTVDARYTVSLAGLSIGGARLAGTVEPGRYTLSASASLSGLVGAITGGKGAAQANGAINRTKVLSNGFALRASNGEITRTVQIGAAAGNVSSVAVDPPFDEKPDRVPINDTHKRGIIDPLSALVMPQLAKDGLDPKNCDRTLPIFDGAQRFDVKLSYVGTENVAAEEGYRGPVLVCRARYQPLAGHRPERRVTKFMIENRDMDVWLAPVADSEQLVPFRIAVKTMVGTAVILAKRFVVNGAAETAKADVKE